MCPQWRKKIDQGDDRTSSARTERCCPQARGIVGYIDIYLTGGSLVPDSLAMLWGLLLTELPPLAYRPGGYLRLKVIGRFYLLASLLC